MKTASERLSSAQTINLLHRFKTSNTFVFCLKAFKNLSLYSGIESINMNILLFIPIPTFSKPQKQFAELEYFPATNGKVKNEGSSFDKGGGRNESSSLS